MAWQDLVFLGGSLLTVLALFPTLRNLEARIPLETSLPKFALALVYTFAFYTLEMTLSAVGLLATAVMWSLVARYRSPTGRALSHSLPLSLRTTRSSIDRSAGRDPNRSAEREGDQF